MFFTISWNSFFVEKLISSICNIYLDVQLNLKHPFKDSKAKPKNIGSLQHPPNECISILGSFRSVYFQIDSNKFNFAAVDICLECKNNGSRNQSEIFFRGKSWGFSFPGTFHMSSPVESDSLSCCFSRSCLSSSVTLLG